ncbi:hypothetical protein IT072_19855 [Leifsonia sp. ZF2019]|uniref:hypothetical protein n=1 Tax=Leifsonia sp. ZF2019 TaxID=2781978 RepID=UPI001CBF52E7|nr:hypothetical protein [Leifsonia sp. ZF2019]UAJ79412.1 hypothetical protein IT072_19855 [Leifsonia sp. ZF2019]
MNDSALSSSRKSALESRIWAAFEAQDFVLECNQPAGLLLVREPTHGSTHKMTVEFDVDRAVADWDELLANRLNPIDHSGWSEVDFVVAELIERLWDGASTASVTVNRLVYENTYFEGIPNPKRRARHAFPGEGSFKWVLDRSENPPGIGPG